MVRKVSCFLIALVMVVPLVLGILGCSQPAPAPTQAPKPTAAPAPSPTVAPKPAPAVTPTPTAAAKTQVIHWDLSVWGAPRGFTRPLEQWVADMAKETNGRWEIKIHYGEVLAAAKDNVDGVKAGLFQAGVSCAVYHPGKTPLHTVFELPFITPESNDEIARLQMVLEEHPALIKEFEKWNALVLLSPMSDTYNFIMSNKRVAKVDDFKGLRIRDYPATDDILKKFGAVGTMISLADTYTALERGQVDAVIAAPSWAGDWKYHEVTKYLSTGYAMGTSSFFVFGSKDAWNALPDDIKAIHKKWQAKSGAEWVKTREADTAKYLPIMKQKMEVNQFPREERDKLVAEAKAAWEDWVKRMEAQGLPGREVLNFLLAKRKEISGW